MQNQWKGISWSQKIRPVMSEICDFSVSIVKNNAMCQISVKERTKSQKSAVSAIVKFWRKLPDGRGFTLGTFSVLFLLFSQRVHLLLTVVLIINKNVSSRIGLFGNPGIGMRRFRC